MGPRGKWGAVALLCCLLWGGVLGPCHVSISPEEPTVEFGSALLLNCTSSCRNYSQLNWEVPVTKLGSSGPGWVSLSIPNVTEWSLELQCFGKFGEQRSITNTTLRVYRLWPPQIDLEEGDLVAGKETRVTCNASARVSPPDPPNVTLTLGGGGVPPSTHQGPWVESSFTVQPEQDGAEVTCRVTLQLRHRTVGTSTTARLRVCTAPHDVQAWAPRDVFTAGENVTVLCRALGNPPPGVCWVLPTNASRQLCPPGGTVTVPAAHRAHAGTYRCLARNRCGVGTATVHLRFQGSPRSPLIPLVVTLAVGTILALLAISWWFQRSRNWKPMLEGSRPG
ncbi:intercellular adhesion molecule 3-like [Falco naumanni]|uniref:intercellular adhesion molecule 3-like n=1 Tax=Falco naumanni TaxID=148594 RepID=UPI001ADE9070|nr:intercellular adhesion molecule 3-like [Falco naumanni]